MEFTTILYHYTAWESNIPLSYNKAVCVTAFGGDMEMPNKRKSYTDEEEQFLKNVGFKVQFLRKKTGMSQFELAEKADMSYTTISHLESTSVYGVSIIALHRIAKALDVSPDQLLRFE